MPIRIIQHPKKASDTPLLISFLVLGLFLSAIFWYGDRLHAIDAAELTPQQLYNTYCAACHGYEGEGVESLKAPPLNSEGTLYEYADGTIQRAILTGGEIMPKHDQILTTTQAAEIINYMKTWWTDEQIASQALLSADDPMEP
ncbi:MAG: cytochrome c [Anaerolineales bacterium]|nr:cytochrome c [Anaerolineales bacterium]